MSEDPLQNTNLCIGLAPVVGVAPKVLILGSMLGRASIDAKQYYAHRANRFWPLMAKLCPNESDRLLSPNYDDRLEGLKRSHVALWDTIGQCERTGSLDSAIRAVVPNPIGDLLKAQPTIERILLNGRKSEAIFKRYLATAIASECPHIKVYGVPSTSPANASMKLDDLLVAWSDAWPKA